LWFFIELTDFLLLKNNNGCFTDLLDKNSVITYFYCFENVYVMPVEMMKS